MEKEKGHLQYLLMNGMNQTAYNVSFVLHEALIIAPMVGTSLMTLVWYMHFHKQDKDMHQFFVVGLAKFNVGLILFVAGITAICLLISKAF